GGFDERGLPFFQRRERRARVFARRLHLRKAADDGGDFRGKLAHRLAPGSSGLAKRRLFARGGREVSPAVFDLPGELDPAPFALRRAAPRREVRGRPAVGLQPLVVPRDRGFEQSEALAQAIPLRRRFSGDEPGGGERCLRLTERGGRGGLGVPSLVAESFGGGERPAQNIRPDARERRAPNLERLGELLVPGGARGLPLE